MKKGPFPRNRYIFLGDLVLIVASVFGSYALRLDVGSRLTLYMPSALIMICVSLVVKPLVYYVFGLYRRYWALAGVADAKLVGVSCVAAWVTSATVVLIIRAMGAFTVGIPRLVLVMDLILSLMFVGGLRLAVRVAADSRRSGETLGRPRPRKRVLVVGAGSSGAAIAVEMTRNLSLKMMPVGFLDDDPEKVGREIRGVIVRGTLKDLPVVVAQTKADEVVLAMPSAPGTTIRSIADACRQSHVPFRTIPTIGELLGGRLTISRLRDVALEDLLRRAPLTNENTTIRNLIQNRRVLVTGAGGSIGLELCRQLLLLEPSAIALLGHGENSVFEASLELAELDPRVNLVPILADIRDEERVQRLFRRFAPQIVFHAAAHKHVPLMEMNAEEAVTNNVFGTRIVLAAAEAVGVDRFVLISTDKATRPASIMGATKALAEMIVREASLKSEGVHVIVRFGNVLGSRGSIVPILQRQIARGGPITITHPDMMRYFMTISEAASLVLDVANMAEKGGEVYVLRMGEQLRVLDLARDLVRLSGLDPDHDIEVTFTGARAGERLSEVLWEEGQACFPTTHPSILRVEPGPIMEIDDLNEVLARLRTLSDQGDAQGLRDLLHATIPGSELGATLMVPGVAEVL